MELIARRPRIQDLTEISKIFRLAVKGNFAADIRLKEIEKEADKLISDLINNVQFDLNNDGTSEFHLVAISKDKIIGIIAYGKANSTIVEHLDIDFEGVHEIKSVYIHPDFQGNGAGSFLFEKILNELKNKKTTKFCLDSGFKNAQKYWTKKLGEPKKIVSDYWTIGVDHMIWLNELEN